MPTQVSFKLGRSQREWLTLRRSENPFSAVGGPLPQITIPLEARVSDRGVSVEILRLAFDLKIGTTLVGQGEIGPNTYLRTEPSYFPATATCPQTALSRLVNPDPPQGRITLTLALKACCATGTVSQPVTAAPRDSVNPKPGTSSRSVTKD